MKRKPVIAVVGRPNVGKSTFVNRLVGKRQSIVDDLPGVTRDRIYFDVEWQNKQFTVIDTGGIIPGDEDEIMISIYDQARIACDEAEKAGVPFLCKFAQIVEQIDKPASLVEFPEFADAGEISSSKWRGRGGISGKAIGKLDGHTLYVGTHS